jgi:alpha-mannosidase
VTLPKDFAAAGDRVIDDHGQPVASQRNANAELVVLARDIPAFGARRYAVSSGEPQVVEEKVVAQGTMLDNGRVKVRLDPQTGDIVELFVHGIETNFAASSTGEALNRYLYFTGDDAAKAVSSGPATIRVKEKGPLVASLLVESTAPGCYSLTREVRLVAGEDRVEIENLVDKRRIPGVNYQAPESKESVNFAFPFNVSGGQVRIDVPFGIVRPDADQIPGSCKNWLTVNRWADIANADCGITWISLDAPLVQLGGLTANLLNSQANPAVWRKRIGPTQKLYAWVMNNHWGTNYRAYQEGPHSFHFVLRPHGAYDPVTASRVAIEQSQPLLPVRAFGPRAPQASRLQLSSNEVMVIGLKPSDDGHAAIVRLWNAAEKDITTRLQWSDPAPRRVSLSDTSEQPLSDAAESIVVPAHSIVTFRAELF